MITPPFVVVTVINYRMSEVVHKECPAVDAEMLVVQQVRRVLRMLWCVLSAQSLANVLFDYCDIWGVAHIRHWLVMLRHIVIIASVILGQLFDCIYVSLCCRYHDTSYHRTNHHRTNHHGTSHHRNNHRSHHHGTNHHNNSCCSMRRLVRRAC